MKGLLFNMKYNFYNIGNRITQERKLLGLSQSKIIEKLKDEYGVKIGRNNYSKIENGEQFEDHFSLGLLFALCDMFNCEVGYLLCEAGYEQKTRRNTDIHAVTGLNKESVAALESIQKQDEIENTITLLPKEIIQLLEKETLSEQETERVNDALFDNPELSSRPSGRPRLMELLNFLLKHEYIENLLMLFRDFVDSIYKYPVYYDEKENKFIYPDNDISGSRIVNFAKSKEAPHDNRPIFLNDGFFDTMTFIKLQNLFNECRTIYEEERKEKKS